MQFSVKESINILERTPVLLHAMLGGISSAWTSQNEGGESWSVFDIVGHLIQGEQTDWMPRAAIILSDRPDKTFEPFDRFVQLKNNKGKQLPQLLEEFEQLRKINLDLLHKMEINDKLLHKKGIHPEFGLVNLSQLLATWAVHDLNHISQICRVMAYQYKDEVGPWVKYLKILQ